MASSDLYRRASNPARLVAARHAGHQGPRAAVGGRAANLLEGAGWSPSIEFTMPGSVTGISAMTGALLSLVDTWRRDHGTERVRIVTAQAL